MNVHCTTASATATASNCNYPTTTAIIMKLIIIILYFQSEDQSEDQSEETSTSFPQRKHLPGIPLGVYKQQLNHNYCSLISHSSFHY